MSECLFNKVTVHLIKYLHKQDYTNSHLARWFKCILLNKNAAVEDVTFSALDHNTYNNLKTITHNNIEIEPLRAQFRHKPRALGCGEDESAFEKS